MRQVILYTTHFFKQYETITQEGFILIKKIKKNNFGIWFPNGVASFGYPHAAFDGIKLET